MDVDHGCGKQRTKTRDDNDGGDYRRAERHFVTEKTEFELLVHPPDLHLPKELVVRVPVAQENLL